VLQVASLEGLMATKVKGILQRAEAKDYRKRRLKTPLDAESTNELQQVTLAVVDLVDEHVI
jgi:predicted nucleotidyltransferase component of viral defense system